ncbi:MAG: hypothetical protein NT025_05730 [bacterium]|nr:hypothetical protein [bacterium]
MEIVLLLITAVGAAATAVGVVAAFYQLRRQTKLQRSAFMKDVVWDMLEPEAVEAFYRIGLAKDGFVWREGFADSEEAQSLDTLIAYCDCLCYLKKNCVVDKSDWQLVQNMVDTVVRDECSAKYWQYWNEQARKEKIALPFPFIDWYHQEAVESRQRL